MRIFVLTLLTLSCYGLTLFVSSPHGEFEQIARATTTAAQCLIRLG